VSNWQLKALPPQRGWYLQVFNASGLLPNGAHIDHTAAGLNANQMVAVAAANKSNCINPSCFVAIATNNGTEGP